MDDLTVGIDAISAGTTLAAGGQVVFSNANNITFGLAGRTVTASAAAAGVTAVSGFGVSTGGNTSGTTGTTIGTIVLAGGNQITLSQATAVNAATITISGRDAIFGAGVSTGGNTLGITGTQTGTLVLAGGNGVTLSQATSPTGLTVTVNGVSVSTVSAFSHNAEFGSNWVAQHGILSLQRVTVPMHVTASSALFVAEMRAPVAATGAMTLSMGVYTMSGSTASLMSSSSGSTSWTSGGATTASSVYGGQSGTRYRPIDFGILLPPGDYLVGVHLVTENAGTWRVFGRQGVSLVEHLALPSNVTQNFLDGVSISSFSTAMPSSVNITDTGYNRTGQSALRQPGFILLTA